jgi:hypothetical protein
MGEADSNEAAAAWSSKTNATLENQSEPSGVQAGKTLFGDRPFSGTDGISPNGRRVHTSADPRQSISSLGP